MCVVTIVPEDCRETIFEGAVFSDNSTFVDVHYDRVNDVARKQMKHVQGGAQAAKWKAYNARYGMQTNQIIEGFTLYEGRENVVDTSDGYNTRGKKNTAKKAGLVRTHDAPDAGESNPPCVLQHVPGMFSGPAGVAANWKMGNTTLVNGVGYQHPHCDAGRPESYKGMKIFPFVTIHGF